MRSTRLILVLLLTATGCFGGRRSGPTERTVLIDYEHDEFSTIMLGYFPRNVAALPGETIRFRQTWTGEPHSVTMGTLVDKALKPFLEAAEKGEPPEGEPEGFDVLPPMFNETQGEAFTVNQTGAQPCFLDDGTPPNDGTPCQKVKQPSFTGRQSYYSSGYIHYQGVEGNRFRVPLANDIAPGSYFYYCNLHGPGMSGVIEVKAKGSRVSSQNEIDRKARSEIRKMIDPLAKAYKEAGSAKAPTQGNLAGFGTEEVQEAAISEFIPKTIEAKVGEKVTWVFVGAHTISFNVPKYFPIISVAKDGSVTFNPRAIEPGGGWPGVPQQPPPEPSEDTQSGKPPEPVIVDAGTWDGVGFRSSGFFFSFGNLGYSVTFTKRGTYTFACLVHPPMVGKVIVS